ncbi:hypothetical protein PENANT_c005G07881 [Penicillium antarcticum]|uniref:Uncharacterized protein n=1 Tax=Penicillium antarcticum TaxID=416450 RepID=A0A1V6QEH7_9EURO|nr:hypothetical protein PENANT_c005G07881 [Penicillium antarcticum]
MESTSLPFVKIMVIGGGFSGLAMGCQLKTKLNCDDFVIYDRAAKGGGTWWANQYPGCGVDIPAVFYSLSVADHFDVARHFVCHVDWEEAHWQEASSTWLVKLKDLSTGKIFQQQCSLLVSAVGGLTVPNKFQLDGIERFEGDIIHTAKWKNDLSMKNKNVVVIGNGSSASQLIPNIAQDAKSITQFIRTPQHYMPSQDMPIPQIWMTLFQYAPIILQILRAIVFLYLETSGPQFNLTKDGAKRRQSAHERSVHYVQSTAPEKYWELLIPKFDLGCKRRVFDNDKYIAILNRENVHLTDDPVVSLQRESVLTKSGQIHPADIIVLATGFALAQYDSKLIGRNGLSRAQHREKYGTFEAFKTVAMAGFPNFFYILGPHSGRGHTSTLLAVENFIDLIIQVAKPVIHNQASYVEVKESSERQYHQQIHAAIGKTVFSDQCSSWYIDKKTGKNWFSYPWSSFTMWYSTHLGDNTDWFYQVSVSLTVNLIYVLDLS